MMLLQKHPCPHPWNGCLCYLTGQKELHRYNQGKDLELREDSELFTWSDELTGIFIRQTGRQRNQNNEKTSGRRSRWRRGRFNDTRLLASQMEKGATEPRNPGELHKPEKPSKRVLVRASWRNSELHNDQRINWCCFQLQNSWWFVTAGTGKRLRFPFVHPAFMAFLFFFGDGENYSLTEFVSFM